ncbi:MAG: hypothetical protein MHM6MM_000423 [Cercozoa sp. M6MM]
MEKAIDQASQCLLGGDAVGCLTALEQVDTALSLKHASECILLEAQAILEARLPDDRIEDRVASRFGDVAAVPFETSASLLEICCAARRFALAARIAETILSAGNPAHTTSDRSDFDRVALVSNACVEADSEAREFGERLRELLLRNCAARLSTVVSAELRKREADCTKRRRQNTPLNEGEDEKVEESTDDLQRTMQAEWERVNQRTRRQQPQGLVRLLKRLLDSVFELFSPLLKRTLVKLGFRADVWKENERLFRRLCRIIVFALLAWLLRKLLRRLRKHRALRSLAISFLALFRLGTDFAMRRPTQFR